DRRQQTIARQDRLLAGVEDHETPGAIGGLDGAFLKAGLADRRCLLVARYAEDRNWTAEEFRVGHAKVGGTVLYPRQKGFGNPIETQQLGVPRHVVDVIKAGAAGIGHIRGMDPAASQAPEEEGIHGAEGEVASL